MEKQSQSAPIPENQASQRETANAVPATQARQKSPADIEEAKLIGRLQMMMNLVIQTIAQDGSLSIDEASQMIADARSAALAMFPGKELAYDLIWRPRFQRLMRERYRIM
jgi:Skp family chaperone for outer membrane proteins